MTTKKHSLFRIYGFAVITTLMLLGYVGIKEGLSSLITVSILAALEVTFSFDNAIINAKILSKMSKAWQTIFMTFGIFVAVFLVRVLLPIYIVALTTATAFGKVVDLVLHDPAHYAEKLEIAQPMIAAFGGIFLLMVFLDFILEQRDITWLNRIENKLQKLGKIENVSVVTALLLLLSTVYFFVSGEERYKVLISGVVGMVVYLFINALDSFESHSSTPSIKVGSSLKTGLIGFMYLELIDASFSLDGVIGAFAITKSVLLIAVGLGIGALFVRAMTVHMLRRGVLEQYRYLEHGAHYAIGILALVMLASIKYKVPEWITGGSGILVIATALWHSKKEAHTSKL
jgi:uncharacterized protein